MQKLIFPWLGGFMGLVLTVQAAWPEFRGPTGDGHAPKTARPPATWSETANVRWKTAIHDKGWSSPVIWDNQIWLTTAAENGTRLYAVCVDAASGKILHDLLLFEVETPQYCHPFNSYASPTPAMEAGRVYVTFGAPGTAAVDTRTGKVLWTRRDFQCNHYRGAGSSPILYQNLLILHFDGSDHQYVVALHKDTGQTVWRVNRSIDFQDLGADGKPFMEGDLRKAFATPQVVTLQGRPLLISQGAKAQYAYDPLTGKEFWRFEERSCHSASGRPLYGNGLLYMTCGFSRGTLLALRPDPQDPTRPPAEAWKTNRSMPSKPSPLLVGDLIFVVDDGGLASCLDALTGQEIWRERIGGNYSASPLYVPATGLIYFFSEDGKTTVIKAGRQFEKVAENRLPAGFMASPAVVGNALILRTRTHLYRIEE
ncbi:MAG: PQQ-binding-like beta-propeller repeat protein [Verrucomicrobiae bacterium]|nr:PQQ-binding-like beta-propeller repeat protein [Verrucomicrobiae bacterium]